MIHREDDVKAIQSGVSFVDKENGTNVASERLVDQRLHAHLPRNVLLFRVHALHRKHLPRALSYALAIC